MPMKKTLCDFLCVKRIVSRQDNVRLVCGTNHVVDSPSECHQVLHHIQHMLRLCVIMIARGQCKFSYNLDYHACYLSVRYMIM